jgi:multidrug efflux pump subunit AcrA (membrane-fusion protein)
MTREGLDRLQAIAGIKRDDELSKVRAVVARMNALAADIDVIAQARDARDAAPVLDIARLSGADVAWHRWSEGRLRDLQGRLAGLNVEHEVALGAARQAFGRADVLSRLAGEQRAQGRAAAARRFL